MMHYSKQHLGKQRTINPLQMLNDFDLEKQQQSFTSNSIQHLCDHRGRFFELVQKMSIAQERFSQFNSARIDSEIESILEFLKVNSACNFRIALEIIEAGAYSYPHGQNENMVMLDAFITAKNFRSLSDRNVRLEYKDELRRLQGDITAVTSFDLFTGGLNALSVSQFLMNSGCAPIPILIFLSEKFPESFLIRTYLFSIVDVSEINLPDQFKEHFTNFSIVPTIVQSKMRMCNSPDVSMRIAGIIANLAGERDRSTDMAYAICLYNALEREILTQSSIAIDKAFLVGYDPRVALGDLLAKFPEVLPYLRKLGVKVNRLDVKSEGEYSTWAAMPDDQAMLQADPKSGFSVKAIKGGVSFGTSLMTQLGIEYAVGLAQEIMVYLKDKKNDDLKNLCNKFFPFYMMQENFTLFLFITSIARIFLGANAIIEGDIFVIEAVECAAQIYSACADVPFDYLAQISRDLFKYLGLEQSGGSLPGDFPFRARLSAYICEPDFLEKMSGTNTMDELGRTVDFGDFFNFLESTDQSHVHHLRNFPGFFNPRDYVDFASIPILQTSTAREMNGLFLKIGAYDANVTSPYFGQVGKDGIYLSRIRKFPGSDSVRAMFTEQYHSDPTQMYEKDTAVLSCVVSINKEELKSEIFPIGQIFQLMEVYCSLQDMIVTFSMSDGNRMPIIMEGDLVVESTESPGSKIAAAVIAELTTLVQDYNRVGLQNLTSIPPSQPY